MRNPTRKVQKMGTTALTVVVATFDSEKTLFWANLGDCRLVLDRGGKTEVLTTVRAVAAPRTRIAHTCVICILCPPSQ